MLKNLEVLMSRPPFRRFVAVAAAAELLPVPLLDTVVQNRARRAAVRADLGARGIEVTDEALAAHCDEPLDAGARLLFWPARKLLKTVFVGWTAWQMWRVARSVQASVSSWTELPVDPPEPLSAL